MISWLMEIFKYGFHGSYLLLFTLVIWLVFFMILISNPGKNINRWEFVSGFIFGLGTLKEYLFYELGPILIGKGLWTAKGSEILYSVLSAGFYYLAIPPMLIFALYFCYADEDYPQFFPKYAYVCYLPSVLMAVVFPCTKTYELQSLPVFCLSVAGYNWFYGILLTLLMLYTLQKYRLTSRCRQLTLAAVSILVPIWFWLIIAFPYHALGITSFTKAWQLNLFILVLVLIFLIYHVFKEGIWGMRFKREVYDWNSDKKTLKRNSHYFSHALKSDLSKITWCVSLMEQKGIDAKELDIIKNSTEHLEQFLQTTKMYSDAITLHGSFVDISGLFQRIENAFVPPPLHSATLLIGQCSVEPLFCDETHLLEMLHNLINNALDSIADDGWIRLSYEYSAKRKQAVITITDNGCGMENSNIHQLSEPFYTTKNSGNNMGMGLYYCWNVMEAHNGRIAVESTSGKGSSFSLIFPIKYKKDAKAGLSHE